MIRVEFKKRDNGPERLLAEAEILFDSHPLEGIKIVGLSLWKGADGEVYVTFPSRSSGSGQERKYFDYIRSQTGEAKFTNRLKAWVRDAYKEWAEGEEF